MGQQQLLLIALSVIIVGAAVAVGVNMFQEGSKSSERDLIYQQAPYVASKASSAWKTPRSMGGLDYDYNNLSGNLQNDVTRLGMDDTMGQVAITSFSASDDSTLNVEFTTIGSEYVGEFNVNQSGEIEWVSRPGETSN